MRATFVRTLVELAEEDERIVLLTGDLGFTVVEPFAERFPDRFFNVGVAEQNMLGVATGLAEAGFVPFVYSIATFATLRSYEFMRNGPVLHRLPVRIVGVGGGLEYGMNGLTHYALEDIAVMRAQPGMTVLAPADFRAGSHGAAREPARARGPIYFRLGKNETQTVPGLDGRLRLGAVEQIGAGRDVAIVATGSIALQAAAAVELLKSQGRRARLVVAACLSPAPADGARRRRFATSRSRSRSRRTTSSGGLGSLVSEVVAESGLRCRVVRCGVRGTPGRRSGARRFLNDAHGLSAEAIALTAIEALDRRDRAAGHRSSPDEEAERGHRVLPGRTGDPGHVRPPDARRSARSASTTRSSSSTTPARTTRARSSTELAASTRASSSSTTRGTSAPRAPSRAACASPPATPRSCSTATCRTRRS